MNFVVDCTIDYNFDMACTASASSDARGDHASVQQVGTSCQHFSCENCNSAVSEQRRLVASRCGRLPREVFVASIGKTDECRHRLCSHLYAAEAF
jgi:hypothetical protein